MDERLNPPNSESRLAIRLLQGYLWYPKSAPLDLSSYLPETLEGASLLWDEMQAPFAFFENGELTSTQHFFQFTALRIYEGQPSNEELHEHAERLSVALNPLLNATPAGVGWQLWEDLRPL
ncbi:DUF3208 domain-containing protein [Deinococcus cellulosilyticus]|uniref:DUF3208 domain-containing protein n=1 Tax=Deinococcus cellulosilyticus (strain DSM 18568 / NBRC 106333 / KACC 11606 / 5516J-15) TaxID=1223518 RepID=A0A511N4J6_DEIC1|nr:DUF3208 domain-containing protein [Deinococcus cellulosilyticus]GEM47398.1 hypothetical protein DC3_30330 [Deinococcus cellulosilyticus NBRC 106333 = KACC 11606]